MTDLEILQARVRGLETEVATLRAAAKEAGTEQLLEKAQIDAGRAARAEARVDELEADVERLQRYAAGAIDMAAKRLAEITDIKLELEAARR